MPVQPVQKAKKGKKQRKYGRNALYCATYERENRREKNKVRRLKKHLVYFPADLVAVKAIDLAMIAIRGY